MQLLYQIRQNCPDKQCFGVIPEQICPDMRKITLEKVASVLRNFDNAVEMDPQLSQKAHASLNRMLELARKD